MQVDATVADHGGKGNKGKGKFGKGKKGKGEIAKGQKDNSQFGRSRGEGKDRGKSKERDKQSERKSGFHAVQRLLFALLEAKAQACGIFGSKRKAEQLARAHCFI